MVTRLKNIDGNLFVDAVKQSDVTMDQVRNKFKYYDEWIVQKNIQL